MWNPQCLVRKANQTKGSPIASGRGTPNKVIVKPLCEI